MCVYKSSDNVAPPAVKSISSPYPPPPTHAFLHMFETSLYTLKVDGKDWEVTCVSMGNPHAVVFVPDVDALDLPVVGPQFETHPSFPAKINTEFVQVLTVPCPSRVSDRHVDVLLCMHPLLCTCRTGTLAATSQMATEYIQYLACSSRAHHRQANNMKSSAVTSYLVEFVSTLVLPLRYSLYTI